MQSIYIAFFENYRGKTQDTHENMGDAGVIDILAHHHSGAIEGLLTI